MKFEIRNYEDEITSSELRCTKLQITNMKSEITLHGNRNSESHYTKFEIRNSDGREWAAGVVSQGNPERWQSISRANRVGK